jgi:hypothetical protein
LPIADPYLHFCQFPAGTALRAILVVQPLMGKYKAAKPKSDAPPTMKPGVPCLVFLVLGMVLTMFLLYEVMKNAS